MPLMPEKRETKEKGEITVTLSVCPTCTEIAGDTRHRVKDKKGVHKCQICRSELTPEYAAKLPGIKEAKRKGLPIA